MLIVGEAGVVDDCDGGGDNMLLGLYDLVALPVLELLWSPRRLLLGLATTVVADVETEHTDAGDLGNPPP